MSMTANDYPVSALFAALVAFKAMGGNYPSVVWVGAALGHRLFGPDRESIQFALERSLHDHVTTVYLNSTLPDLGFVLEP